MKKLLLSLVALLGVSAVAMADYEAQLIFCEDGTHGDYDASGDPTQIQFWGEEGTPSTTVTTVPGTYTITTDKFTGCDAVWVLTIDILGMWSDYTTETLSGSIDDIKIGGTSIAFNPKNVNCYEQSGGYRLEIINAWGSDEIIAAPVCGVLNEGGSYSLDITGDFSVTFTLTAEPFVYSSISNIQAEDAVEVARYNIVGQLLSAPEKGINIVKYSDGTSKKELVK